MVLFLVLMSQNTNDRIVSAQIADFNRVVLEDSVQQARHDGYFTSENINSTRSEIARLCKVNEGDVIINVTTTPKYRGDVFSEYERIEYEFTIPLNNIIAVAGFWGIDSDSNSVPYTIRGSVESELLMP